MGTSYNPRIPTDGLISCWDSSNASKSARGFKNVLNLASWTLGTGIASGSGGTTFNLNGTAAENQRILDTGPFGVSTVIWDEPSNDVTSNDDGGWVTAAVPIDNTKLYRFSTWVRRKIIGDGTYYFGVYGYNASSVNTALFARTNVQVSSTNMYFGATSWPTASVPANAWMLNVGHIWPAGSGTGANHVDSGYYTTSGFKFSNPTYYDLVWDTTHTQVAHRSYLYYSIDTTTNQQWYQPRIDLCDGSEPSIRDLIAGVGSRWYDPIGNITGNILNSAALYNSASGYMRFDAVDDCVITPSISQSIRTIITWVRPTAVSGDYVIFGPDSNGADNWLSITTNKINCFFTEITDVNGTFLVGNTTLSANTWYQISCTIDTNTVKVYLNGVEDGSTTVAFTVGTWNTTCAIGRRGSTNQRYFSGDIANVSIYNRVLTPEEILQNFNALRGRFAI